MGRRVTRVEVHSRTRVACGRSRPVQLPRRSLLRMARQVVLPLCTVPRTQQATRGRLRCPQREDDDDRLRPVRVVVLSAYRPVVPDPQGIDRVRVLQRNRGKRGLLADDVDILAGNSDPTAWAQGVAGSNPVAPTKIRRSIPGTWVTVYSAEDIGNTFGPKGFSIGSRRQVSRSK
jgi:hypothetical protein